jgi:dTDP-4-amino-4,6-dideoxygalactose transaminase
VWYHRCRATSAARASPALRRGFPVKAATVRQLRDHQLTSAAPTLSAEPPQIIFGSPVIGEEEIAEVVDTLRSGWWGTGPKTEAFEQQMAAFVGQRFAVGTNSGTAAMHLALRAMGVGAGDEVITTPLTFVATANVIEHCGAKPVFVDVHSDSGTIDPELVAAATTARTKAVLPVHYAGALADVPEIRRRLPDLAILVDAAHCVEGRYPDGSSSAAGGATATAYSFYVTKNVATGEGGMLVTGDEAIAARARAERLHGMSDDAWSVQSGQRRRRSYELLSPGFKFNMTDLQASLGIHQLARVTSTLARRAQLWDRYNEALQGLPGVTLPPLSTRIAAPDGHARHLYTVWLDWQALAIDRQELVSRLSAGGIGIGWHFPAVHLQTYYRDRYGYVPGAFPVAERIAERTVSLPLSARLTDAEAERVLEAFRAALP